ncbi:hypothetical protein BCU85_07640 [Vibrio lentus]|uniref:Transposase n=2 Tax=Vibrio TaxID=662 RepID=A0A855INM8_9VIBR|nr:MULTISPECIES: IS91 family transposase [Vibrio]MCB5362040.1 IS91 family transposase [Vibrio lentus]MCB5452375.1 IS91 family transposase [Vibrio lentus]MCB5464409.1 IS91 family transposase [Vibrio lentus]MCC4795043.1 IS91 family transposase [Vibrio lentus]MCC4815260.1 IS91 family transposase [Vibrio lentus]
MATRTSVNQSYQPRPIKFLFEYNKAWTTMLENDPSLRDVEVAEVTKMLACGMSLLGGKRVECENESCQHGKDIWFTCSSRACSCCGKKSTDNWIAQQVNRLPHCPWMHMTFTMPDVFWPLFLLNRHWLDKLSQLAVDNLLYAAKQKGLKIGIFCALHTFGRRLTWHPHVHASVTLGGINTYGDWKALSYCHQKVEKRWRNQLCDFLLSQYDTIEMENSEQSCRDYDEFRRFINTQRQRFWHVHFAKKTQDPKATINYLGRYLKRPPISGAKLAHYRGEASLSFRYLDHHTGKYETEQVTQLELIKRLIQHIPEKHCRMIRYFGFLANRVVGERLPTVRCALGMARHPEPVSPIRYGQMIKSFLRVDPFECILCGSRLHVAVFHAGIGRQPLVNEALSRRGEAIT